MGRDISPEEASRIISDNNQVKFFFTGLLMGAVIGGVLGLLYAPKKGSETRQFIKDKAQDAAKMIQYKAEGIKEMALEVADNIRAKAAETRRRGEEELKSLKDNP